MTDHDALRAAVLASPADDVARLVYADWLEETGEPANVARAEFIRVGIEYATNPLPDGVDPCRHIPCDWCDGTGTERVCDAAGDMDEQACRKCSGHQMISPYRHHSYAVAIALQNREERLLIENWRAFMVSDSLTGSPECDEMPFDPPYTHYLYADEFSARLRVKYDRGFISTVEGPLIVVRKHLPMILSRSPVIRVKATDKRPLHNTDYGKSSWEWYGDGWRSRTGESFGDDPEDIPNELLSRTNCNDYGDSYRRSTHYAENDALVALSEAVLAEARDALRSREAVKV